MEDHEQPPEKTEEDIIRTYPNNLYKVRGGAWRPFGGIAATATGGGTDDVMTIVSRNLSDFQCLVEQLLKEEIGIDRYVIYIVTKQVKKTALNLVTLLSE